MNHLLITFSDGKRYTIPVLALAENIARFFAKSPCGIPYSETFDAELKLLLASPRRFDRLGQRYALGKGTTNVRYSRNLQSCISRLS